MWGAWDTYVQTCPSADSLAVGRLHKPKVLQFPHPKKCCHLSPGALFSFQGFCGVGRLGSRAWRGPALPCLTWSRNRLGLLSQTQLLLPACAPGRSHPPVCGVSGGVRTNLCDGCSPCHAVHTSSCQRIVSQQVGEEASSCRDSLPVERAGQDSALGVAGFSSHCRELGTELKSLWQSNLSIRTLN